MKGFAGALITVGILLVLLAWYLQREVTKERDAWRDASDQVRSFEQVMPISTLVQKKTLTQEMAIPTDPSWQLLASRLKPGFFIIRKGHREGLAIGPRPANPLDPIEGHVKVNGAEVALDAVTVHNEWGYCIPVRLGDQVELQLTATGAALPAEGTLQWGVDFDGGKEDRPAFGWSLRETFSDLVKWTEIGLAAVGSILVPACRRKAA